MGRSPSTGAVLVVGGGVGGIQASLDLADSGFKVYLAERRSALGRTMAGLDKTFPTNDCSMCILSPKLVECGRHLNIEVLTGARLTSLDGEAGDFTARLTMEPRFVSLERCTGCGRCAQVCPIKVPDRFNGGLSTRRAIHRLYEQAFPHAYTIDPDTCVRCGLCAKACEAGAVDLTMTPSVRELRVGAVVACPGFEPFDPRVLASYGYGVFPNVVTAPEFERILSASGPYRGKLLRPSDHGLPGRIAWIQCVGSRDIHRVHRPYCSSVCCTCAIKEAVTAMEHGGPGVSATLFYIDIRTHGKDFERYYQRARDEYGVRFVRSEIQRICRDPSGSLILRYPEKGVLREETFDLVVLSGGMTQDSGREELASVLGVERNEFGFCRTLEASPVSTSVPGVFAAGAFTGPRDIPETVMEASAAAAEVQILLAPARNTLTLRKTYPPERNVEGERPRIGVFVCHCGVNIGGVVDVPEVRAHAEGLPNVVFAEDALFVCSQDSQQRIRDRIQEHRLNRVVVAACTPRTHEPLFRETLREAGLNPYLVEMANIRDQCAWVHPDRPEKATRKAMDLVRMASAKARLLRPLLSVSLPVERSALVVGGGVAGMTCALTLSSQGLDVHLVEKTAFLGGNARRLRTTLEGMEVPAFLEELEKRVCEDPRITLHRSSRIREVSGYVGNFTTGIQGDSGEIREISHGAAILAVGGEALVPGAFLYGFHPGVFTLQELEAEIPDPGSRIRSGECVVFIQCVGSRETGRPYCSRTCCGKTVKLALETLRVRPEARIYVLYRDMRTYGFQELHYLEARRKGVLFIPFDPEDPPLAEAPDGEEGKLRITVTEALLQERITLEADVLGLAAAMVPSPDCREMAGLFKVPLNADGFFMEAHSKLRPVDFSVEGVFVCGLSHGPKSIPESIAQAKAAACRASTVLGRDVLEAGGTVSVIRRERCNGCGLCEALCPYGAIQLAGDPLRAEVNGALCKGCGVCAASCRSGAADIQGFTDGSLLAMIHHSLPAERPPR